MKIAIASDIHGSLSALRVFLTQADALGADKILLLGDLYYHGVRNPLPDEYKPLEVAKLLNARKKDLIVVRGNCDSEVDRTVSEFDMVPEVVLFLGGKRIHASHGDRYDAERLPASEYDVVLYGHYHTGFIRKVGDTVVANPGSPSLPKGGTVPSFLLLDEKEITLYSLDGSVLDKRVL